MYYLFVCFSVNGDLLPDLFGTAYNQQNASDGERTYWIAAKFVFPFILCNIRIH